MKRRAQWGAIGASVAKAKSSRDGVDAAGTPPQAGRRWDLLRPTAGRRWDRLAQWRDAVGTP